ncbi:MAG: hypothetical protein HOI70_07700, partial [Opitutae bacterium]|nr:hypothetical protein [Opitutae bacterium]
SGFHAAKSIENRHGVIAVVRGVGLANDQSGIGLSGQGGAVLFPLISEVLSGRSGFEGNFLLKIGKRANCLGRARYFGL